MTDPLEKWMDLVIKQTEKVSDRVDELQKQVAVLSSIVREIQSKLGELDDKVDDISACINGRKDACPGLKDLQKKVDELHPTQVVKAEGGDVERRGGFVGLALYVFRKTPAWLASMLLSVVLILLGAIIGSGHTQQLMDLIFNTLQHKP